MKVFLFTIISLSFTFAQADFRTMPVLTPVEMEAKLDIVSYAANHSFEQTKLEKTKYGFTKLYHMQGELSYTEYLNNLNGKLKVDVYMPRKIKGKKLPVVIIFPPIGGVSKLDELTAKFFAKEGYIAVISHLSENILGQDSVESTMGGFVRSMVRNRILLDYIMEHPNVNRQRIGVYGVSLGGIRASLFYSIDTRVKSAATVVGGINLPGIMAYSEQSTVVSLRERFMADNGLSDPYDYESLLLDKYYIDGSNFASQVDPNQFYMVIGKKDKKVHTRYQYEMYDSFDSPKMSSYKLNHTWTILYMFLRKRKVTNFFDRSFGIASSAKIYVDEDEPEDIDPELLDEVIEEVELNLD